eukprot:8835656-Pyramimonas_sp.AAC.1
MLPDRYQGVDVLVLLERHGGSGTAVLVHPAVGGIVAVTFHFAEIALDVADQPVDVLLASSDLQVVDVHGTREH